MDGPATDVVKFAPKQNPRGEGEPIDQLGHAVVALINEAENISNENVDRAMTMARRVSLELRAAEDRIRQLQAEVERLESRATRAEQWLEVIKKEIEDRLIAPMEANRSQAPMLH